MKKFLNLIICFIGTMILISGCAGQNKYGNFKEAAELNQIRYDHTATLLPDGNVLIAGGYPNGEFGIRDTAELYLTKENRFVMTGKMNEARARHVAILLKNGKVLLLGGEAKGYEGKTDTVEEYDYKIGQFRLVGHLLQRSYFPKGVLLDDGRVFIYEYGAGYAEIYDPVTNKSKYTSQLNYARGNASIVKLQDGRVLIIGGDLSPCTDGKFNHTLPKKTKNPKEPLIKSTKTAEIYDPKTNTYKLILGLNKERNGEMSGGPSSIILPSGEVMILGGTEGKFTKKKGVPDYYDPIVVPEIELYNPLTQKFTIVGKINNSSQNLRLSLLKNKYLLITGSNTKYESLIDLSTFKTVETPKMIIKRADHTVINISPDKVLFTGGGDWHGTKKAKTSEIFELNNKLEGAGK